MKNITYSGDLCIIKSPSNLFYLSQYENADAVIVIDKGKNYYFTDARYFEEVKCLQKDFVISDIKDFKAFISDGDFRATSVEKNLSVADYLELKSYGIQEFNFIDEEISKLRAVKSEKELNFMISAQAITDKAFEKILSCIKEGITERELASKLEAFLFESGGEDLAFKTIVAFGENTSKPHAHRTDKKLEKGMPITMDFGAKFGGYCSDMTRTVFLGEPSKKIKDIYYAVAEAQEAALAGINVGMTGRECDAIARNLFAKKNLDKYFLHSLGHGLGIDIHEYPNFSPKCEAVMREGMVLSVEPGLYFAGEFGVRIEDVIYFGENGIINLTKSPKNMIII